MIRRSNARNKKVKKRIEEKLRPLNLPKTIDALRDEICRHVERGVYSVDLVRSIEKMSANSDSPIGVLKTCFELIEHSVLIPISTFFNSAYVHGV